MTFQFIVKTCLMVIASFLNVVLVVPTSIGLSLLMGNQKHVELNFKTFF